MSAGDFSGANAIAIYDQCGGRLLLVDPYQSINTREISRAEAEEALRLTPERVAWAQEEIPPGQIPSPEDVGTVLGRIYEQSGEGRKAHPPAAWTRIADAAREGARQVAFLAAYEEQGVRPSLGNIDGTLEYLEFAVAHLRRQRDRLFPGAPHCLDPEGRNLTIWPAGCEAEWAEELRRRRTARQAGES